MTIARVRVALSGTAGTPGVMTFYFAATEATPVETVLDPVQALMTGLKTQIVQPLQMTQDGTVDYIEEATGALVGSATGNLHTEGASASAADAGPRAAQAVVRLGTGLIVNGRRLRGRLFIPQPRAASSFQVPTNAQALLQSPITTFLNATQAEAPWVVWSRKGGVTAPVTSATIWDQWGVLRSRRD